jgi:hypothetical protein
MNERRRENEREREGVCVCVCVCVREREREVNLFRIPKVFRYFWCQCYKTFFFVIRQNKLECFSVEFYLTFLIMHEPERKEHLNLLHSESTSQTLQSNIGPG